MKQGIGYCKLLVLVLASMPFGCGGGSSSSVTSTPSGPRSTLITLSPVQVQVIQGGTQSFSVSGAVSVTWSVQEGSAGGTITPGGLYTAPYAAGIYHIVATSQADNSITALAVVTVPNVALSPTSASAGLATGDLYLLSNLVSVTGTINNGITWTIQEGSSGGSITNVGLYSAPATPGTYHVIATSQANSALTATITITVSMLTVQVFPTSDVLGFGGTRDFWASTNSMMTRPFAWSLAEGSAAGVLSGDLTTIGVTYAAPAATGTFHVEVAAANTSANQMATVTVVASGFRLSTGQIHDTTAGLTATTLPDGTVLLAGGDPCTLYYYYGSCPVSTGQVYDPKTDTVVGTPAMGGKRAYHTATLLPNGTVLIAGGSDASTEIYDPTEKTFTFSGSMTVGRSSHTATLLNNGKVLIVGGYTISGVLASAELYDPASKTFAATGSMTTARGSHTATILADGSVLIVGGGNGSTELASAEVYDPAKGTFTAVGSMSMPRALHTATLLGSGKVLVTGGEASGNTLQAAELYDPAKQQFTTTGNMLTARDSHFASPLPNGTVLISGGEDYTAEVYDPTTGLFTQTGSARYTHYSGAAALLLDGRVLIAGGSDSTLVELYK